MINATICQRLAWIFMAGSLLTASLSTSAVGQEELFSGPQPGEALSPFKVLQVLTPEEVEEVDLAEPTDEESTTVVMFMHKLSEPAIGLMMTIEWYAGQQEGLNDHYVMLTDDISESTLHAKRWAQRPFFSESPMSISVDGLEGPGRYGLNRNVDMTVLVAKDNQVVSNFTINGPNNTDAPEILAAIADAIDEPAPSFEEVRDELRAERQRQREMRRRENPNRRETESEEK